MLRTEDFNDDTKDAGEIGAGHTVTALYEIVPAGQPLDLPPVDNLKYQPSDERQLATTDDQSRELLTLKMRYKEPQGDASRKLEWPVIDEGQAFGAASDDFQFAAAVAGLGLVLRDSQYKGNLTPAAVLELAQGAIGRDEQGYRAEFLELVRRAKSLRGD
jgi:Ca-activated chloride channel family protein